SMADLIVCAILVTGLGVLNDVTITQASAVWELATVAPDLKAGQLFARAMRIGRDHIASTVYTITFAYVGSALLTLIIVSAYDQSFFETLTRGEMSVEVVSILVCSIGLVIAIPVTTGLGVLVVRSGLRPGPARDSRGGAAVGDDQADEGVATVKRESASSRAATTRPTSGVLENTAVSARNGVPMTTEADHTDQPLTRRELRRRD
ncbi:MAG: YibE/F family protein, partial [Brevibacterium aurantiacum]